MADHAKWRCASVCCNAPIKHESHSCVAYCDECQRDCETVPGARETIDRLAEEAGGWVCEQHPDLEWPHDNCEGPGMLRSDL